MSQTPSFDNADPPSVMNGGDPEHPTTGPKPATDAEPGRDMRDADTTAATNGRLMQDLDYRLRSLRTEAGDAPVTSARTDHRQRQRHRPLLATAAIFVGVAALALALLQAFVIQPFAVPGDAMTPTLQTGDRILVLKSGLLTRRIQSGDIIVFHLPESSPCSGVGGRSGDLVLRVVALPGEVIWSVGETIFVDGRPLRERASYDPRFGQVGSTPIRKTTLGEGRYFVLADNRSDACDSRAFGPISKSSVVGEGIAIVGRDGHASFGTL